VTVSHGKENTAEMTVEVQTVHCFTPTHVHPINKFKQLTVYLMIFEQDMLKQGLKTYRERISRELAGGKMHNNMKLGQILQEIQKIEDHVENIDAQFVKSRLKEWVGYFVSKVPLNSIPLIGVPEKIVLLGIYEAFDLLYSAFLISNIFTYNLQFDLSEQVRDKEAGSITLYNVERLCGNIHTIKMFPASMRIYRTGMDTSAKTDLGLIGNKGMYTLMHDPGTKLFTVLLLHMSIP
jgi:hypothetical protein